MIRYMPKLDSMLWSKKSIEYFDTPDDLKAFVADQRTKFYHFIGKNISFVPHDVELVSGKDLLMGWENYHHVILGGITIGVCGE